MMTLLREKTVWILWFVIFAFVGLIVVEWGADYTGGDPSQSAGDIVGVVNGEEIRLKEFQGILRQAASQSPREQRGDEGDLVRKVWQSYVQEIILRQEIDRLGVDVSDKEVAYFTRIQPPPAVQSIEAFQTDGAFDLEKYTQFVGDPSNLQDPNNRNFVIQVESMMRQQLLNHKLQRLITSSIQLSPDAVRDSYAESNEQVKVEYVFVPNSTIDQSEVSISEDEIEAHYESNISGFEHPELVNLAYMYFPKVASSADSAAVAKEAIDLRSELIAGADFATLAEVASDDPGSASQGGSLGTFGKGRMVQKFSDAAFALKVGEISEPVLTRFGWHLIKVDDRSVEDGEEKITASHILLQYKPKRATKDALREMANELRDRALVEGFDVVASVSGVPVTDSGFLKESQHIAALGQNTAFLVNWGLSQTVGAVSSIGEDDRGIWIASVSKKRSPGILQLSDVRDQVERAVRAEATSKVSGLVLETVRSKVEAGSSFEEAAIDAGLEIRRPQPFSRNSSVPGLGRGSGVIGASFLLDEGDLSEVITQQDGAYLIHSLEKTSFDENEFSEQKDEFAQQLLVERQQEVVENWFAQLYDSAKIEDNRHQFFTF
ncbi:MAG: peptidylprolyl isomerase [Candidatus Latescibacterota bacterium]|nr:peptidylprolyl isomerase [Candidatus Latescibacterota bacterium]